MRTRLLIGAYRALENAFREKEYPALYGVVLERKVGTSIMPKSPSLQFSSWM
jgi:hypothetical protein